MDKFVVRTSASGAVLPAKRPRLFVDLDGVLADFDTKAFYASLPWMSDGQALWEFVKQYQPTILTGLPMGTWAEAQKRDWCARMLGPSVPVICCMARDKHKYCQAGDILIDDREEKARGPWEQAGGSTGGVRVRDKAQALRQRQRRQVLLLVFKMERYQNSDREDPSGLPNAAADLGVMSSTGAVSTGLNREFDTKPGHMSGQGQAEPKAASYNTPSKFIPATIGKDVPDHGLNRAGADELARGGGTAGNATQWMQKDFK